MVIIVTIVNIYYGIVIIVIIVFTYYRMVIIVIIVFTYYRMLIIVIIVKYLLCNGNNSNNSKIFIMEW